MEQVHHKLVQHRSLREYVTLDEISSPYLNVENTIRVTLCKDGKECGATIPLVLFSGLKAKHLIDSGEKYEDIGTDSLIQSVLRNLLSGIHNQIKKENLSGKIMVSKTLQEKVFRHIVFDEPMFIESSSELVVNNSKNRAHTVGDNKAPSSTIQSYLCRWLLEEQDLNPDSDFRHINNDVKKISRDIYFSLKKHKDSEWKKQASFSRRLQNAIMFKAFKTVFHDDDISSVKLRRPG